MNGRRYSDFSGSDRHPRARRWVTSASIDGEEQLLGQFRHGQPPAERAIRWALASGRKEAIDPSGCR